MLYHHPVGALIALFTGFTRAVYLGALDEGEAVLQKPPIGLAHRLPADLMDLRGGGFWR